MARTDIRPVVKLRSTAGTGYTYVTRKNRRNAAAGGDRDQERAGDGPAAVRSVALRVGQYA